MGGALAAGGWWVIGYVAARRMPGALIVFVAVLLPAIGALAGLQVLAVLGGIVAFVVTCYIVVKLSLVAPVIAIEGERNPVRALRRSWKLTRGQSFRLFLFYLLLLVAFMALSVVITLVLGLPFALAGEQAALLGEGVLSGLVNAVMVVVAVCVLAAVHTQLARLGHERTPPADG